MRANFNSYFYHLNYKTRSIISFNSVRNRFYYNIEYFIVIYKKKKQITIKKMRLGYCYHK